MGDNHIKYRPTKNTDNDFQHFIMVLPNEAHWKLRRLNVSCREIKMRIWKMPYIKLFTTFWFKYRDWGLQIISLWLSGFELCLPACLFAVTEPHYIGRMALNLQWLFLSLPLEYWNYRYGPPELARLYIVRKLSWLAENQQMSRVVTSLSVVYGSLLMKMS